MGAVVDEAGLTRVVLPHYTLHDLLDLLAWEHPSAIRDEGPFERLIALGRDYFNGLRVNFAEVRCAPGAPGFSAKVYDACRRIPYGQTLSYSALAREIGRPEAARAVATAMSRNPVPLVVPCHRVTHADGRVGGFSAAGGEALKRRLLDLEAGRQGRS